MVSLGMMRKVEISHKTIIFTVAFAILLWFLYSVKDVIFALFASILLMAILNPLVTRLTKFRIPRGISVLLVYVLVVGVLGATIASIITPLVNETSSFATGLPKYLENAGIPAFLGQETTNNLLSQLVQIPGQVLSLSVSFFSNMVMVVGSLVFAFYLLLAREKLENQLSSFFGEEKGKRIAKMIDNLEFRLGNWMRGQLLLMLLIGVATFLGLILLGIPYALPLAILAGILEIVPTLGPIIAAIPSIIIGFGISPFIGFAAAFWGLLIHQIENYLFFPKIMEKSVGVSPIITLLALAIGAKLAGIAGVFISMPVLITSQVLLKEYLSSKD